jgi:ferrous iron transport protein A
MMRVRISELRPGDRARIVGYGAGEKSYRAKLLAMGLTRGAELTFVKRAPLGDPIEVEVRGFALSLRRSEAEQLELERLDGQVRDEAS